MAEIPVTRAKRGLPWWLWLLPLLALLLLLLFFSRSCNDRAAIDNNTNRAAANNANGNSTTNGTANGSAVVNGSGTTNNANASGTTANGNASGNSGNSNINVSGVGAASGDRVTDVNLFANTADKSTIVGRRVDLTKVKVNRVLSDRVFTVTSGSGEMFVLLDENLDTGGGKEQQIKMRPGQLVNLGGTFRNVPTGEVKEERSRNLNRREYEQMKDQRVYLHCTDVKNAG